MAIDLLLEPATSGHSRYCISLFAEGLPREYTRPGWIMFWFWSLPLKTKLAISPDELQRPRNGSPLCATKNSGLFYTKAAWSSTERMWRARSQAHRWHSRIRQRCDITHHAPGVFPKLPRGDPFTSCLPIKLLIQILLYILISLFLAFKPSQWWFFYTKWVNNINVV